jgi:alpha-D-ribose 1-methylphosphonate 5-triphosphate synthase subunit PhnH
MKPRSIDNFLSNDDTPPFRTESVIDTGEGAGSPGETLALKGPGIPPDGRTIRLSPAEAAWCRARDERGFEYPCGVELVFLREDDSLLALPRKTEFRWD